VISGLGGTVFELNGIKVGRTVTPKKKKNNNKNGEGYKTDFAM